MNVARILLVRSQLVNAVANKSTGDLMKDCGWDKLAKRANKWKEAERKDNRVAMKLIPEPLTGLPVPLIQTESHGLAVVDGTPQTVRDSSVALIRRRPKIVTQSGVDNVGTWELRFATQERWENPCMGWCSTGHPVSNLSMYFNSSEEASDFACRHGWTYEIEDDEPYVKPKKFVKKSYSDNFHWNRRIRVSTK